MKLPTIRLILFSLLKKVSTQKGRQVYTNTNPQEKIFSKGKHTIEKSFVISVTVILIQC
jgi:hypothetical protein